MVHKTGPREDVVETLHNRLYIDAYKMRKPKKPEHSERLEAAQRLEREWFDELEATPGSMRKVRAAQRIIKVEMRKAIAPIAKICGCPTCPKD